MAMGGNSPTTYHVFVEPQVTDVQSLNRVRNVQRRETTFITGNISSVGLIQKSHIG